MLSGKDRLVEAAFALFAAKGFANTSSREVAQRAGVSLGLIHKHFSGMNGLLEATDQRCLELAQGKLASQLGPILLSTATGPDSLQLDDEAAVYLTRALTTPRQGSEKLYAACMTQYVDALTVLQEQHALSFSQPLPSCARFLISLDVGLFALAPLADSDTQSPADQIQLIRTALLR